jgi:endoglucanase
MAAVRWPRPGATCGTWRKTLSTNRCGSTSSRRPTPARRRLPGRRPAVILEPDGLARLSSAPWCAEEGGGLTGTPEDFGLVDARFREIDFAIDRLSRNPRTAVYIDAGHSAWRPPNDDDAGSGEPQGQLGMASRLLKGGIHNASSCSDAEIAAAPSDPSKLTHFVLDTSRNGKGHWTPPFLWVKRPGESDGRCTRGTAGPEDPEYGSVDPPAGQWWADYALGLAQRASPPLAH